MVLHASNRNELPIRGASLSLAARGEHDLATVLLVVR
jgi:hypothetical protein